jgi:hypothetical protein
VIVAPDAPGERLVPASSEATAGTPSIEAADRIDVGTNGEIRLTYAQLTALIDETVRQLAGKA